MFLNYFHFFGIVRMEEKIERGLSHKVRVVVFFCRFFCCFIFIWKWMRGKRLKIHCTVVCQIQVHGKESERNELKTIEIISTFLLCWFLLESFIDLLFLKFCFYRWVENFLFYYLIWLCNNRINNEPRKYSKIKLK